MTNHHGEELFRDTLQTLVEKHAREFQTASSRMFPLTQSFLMLCNADTFQVHTSAKLFLSDLFGSVRDANSQTLRE